MKKGSEGYGGPVYVSSATYSQLFSQHESEFVSLAPRYEVLGEGSNTWLSNGVVQLLLPWSTHGNLVVVNSVIYRLRLIKAGVLCCDVSNGAKTRLVNGVVKLLLAPLSGNFGIGTFSSAHLGKHNTSTDVVYWVYLQCPVSVCLHQWMNWLSVCRHPLY